MDRRKMEKMSFKSKLVEHVFLPLSIAGGTLDTTEVEDELLSLFTSEFESFVADLPDKTEQSHLAPVVNTFRVWETLQSHGQDTMEPKAIMSEIRALSPGETFALYIRAQNSGFMISIPSEDNNNSDGPSPWTYISSHAIVSTFPASLPSEEVTVTPGPIAVILPTTSILVPRTMTLNSKCFARQLSVLSSRAQVDSMATITKAGHLVGEERDVPNPKYVTEWLSAVLADPTSKAATPKQMPRIVKKIRDVVLFFSCANEGSRPFRRSGLWMVARTVLHICLIQALGPFNGGLAFKIFMIRFCRCFLDEGTFDLYADPGRTMEMMAKIARRARKIQLKLRSAAKSKKSEEILLPCLQQSFQELMEDSSKIMQGIHYKMKASWTEYIRSHRRAQHKDFLIQGGKPIEFHSMSKSGFHEYIHSKRQPSIGMVQEVVPHMRASPRHTSNHRKFVLSHFDCQEEDVPYVLHDFEENVNHWLTDIKIHIEDYEYVARIFQSYFRAGRIHYMRDPVGWSRMILTCLKIIFVWDGIVCQAYPMLLEHRTGIDLDWTMELLLPDVDGMEALQSLENYFQTRDSIANYPFLIEETEIKSTSFSARYGSVHPKLQAVRATILEESEERIRHKLKEVRIARSACEKLQLEIKTLECEYNYDNWRRRHDKGCKKCQLSRKLKNSKVTVYERPLPTNEECQFGVLFELILPGPIGCLRDILYSFGFEVIGSIMRSDSLSRNPSPEENPSEFTESNEKGILYGPWWKYEPLQRWVEPQRKHEEWTVSLMSTKKLFKLSHYDTLHPTNPDSDFIKNNGYNCRLAGNLSLFTHTKNTKFVKNSCTLRVTKKSPYASLQYAIDGEIVTANQVLARQNECHPDLSLHEFIEFGSIRSSNRLQLRNIYRALTQMTLSFKNESVFNLICQCIWQAGPALNEVFDFNPSAIGMRLDDVLRQSHQDIANTSFTRNMLEVLENMRVKHAHNWKDHYILLSVIVIACRIAECSNDAHVAHMALCLLEKCRANGMAWLTEVRNILATSTKAPRSEIDLLRIKMIEISVSASMSFNVSSELLGNVLTEESIKQWLLAIANIYDNIVLIGSGMKSSKEVVRVLPPTLQSLIRRVKETGLRLEPILKKKIQNGEDIFTSFVLEHYTGSCDLRNEMRQTTWVPVAKDSHTYRCELETKINLMHVTTTFHMDIIGGGFLVDGCPVSYLPASIENHPMFQRTFPTKSFAIGPYPYQRGRMMTLESFCTSEANPLHYNKYSFYLQSEMDGQSLIVTEHRYTQVQSTWQLLPHTIFARNIPFILIEDYTHWWRKETGIIEFFKREKDTPTKLFNNRPDYSLNLNTLLLTEISTDRVMVDINSQVFQKVVTILSRLEHHNYINFWHDVKGKNKYIVELPRMGLQFRVNNPGRVLSLSSKEYRGMKVSDGTDEEDGLSTLIGLNNGLLLIDADKGSKVKLNSILLVPHGTPILHDEHNLQIMNKDLRTPSFFAYDCDRRLKQLKAGESQAGWMFLALLHAATSSYMPDPFTGVTGTERAFQILQSGHCWSGEPLDIESIRTLREIANFSPSRHYYPPKLRTMETVDWPLVGIGGTEIYLPPHIAHDGFQLIVHKLLQDSRRLAFLYPSSSATESSAEDEEQCSIKFYGQPALAVKSYWSRIGASTEICRIYPTFDETMAFSPTPTPTTSRGGQFPFFDPVQFTSILHLAQMGHTWKASPPLNSKGLLTKLLMNGKDLQGITTEVHGGFKWKEDSSFWGEIDFRDSWLSLYVHVHKKAHVQSAKKDFVPEWIHLLTHLAFRKNKVDFQQLALLHCVAVHPQKFKGVDPPDYIEYFMTNEYEYNSDAIEDVLKTHVIAWGEWMDQRVAESGSKPQNGESVDDYISRMEPIYQEEVSTEIATILDAIKKAWPIESCDGLEFFKEKIWSGLWTTDAWTKAMAATNTLLRNWYRNKQLFTFLEKVENGVNALPKNEGGFVNTIRAFTHNWQSSDKQKLAQICEKGIFTIDFEDVIGEREVGDIDYGFNEEARRIFDGNGYQPNNLLKSKSEELKSAVQAAIATTTVPQPPVEFPLKQSTDCPILNEYMNDLEKSWIECHKEEGSLGKPKSVFPVQVTQLSSETSKRALEMWERVRDVIRPFGSTTDPILKMMISAQIFPRVVPLSLFPYICRRDFGTPGKEFLDYVRNILGAYGVLLTLDQRSARCFRHRMKGKYSFEVELKSELSHSGHENWSPSLRPEWLLFELEMDLMVRPIQATVAENMENPTANENALLQLNMGEGKTAVIVPLLVLSLANGRQLCRVTVLKSLFEINQKALISRIGGLLLNRRVYTFPCRRDFQIGLRELDRVFTVYKECMSRGGVVIGLSEHRLSFKLKAYESCGAEHYEEGRKLLEIGDWLNANARDVLDESDEILQVKYQLIYTLGKQSPICGGSTRWTIIQKLLSIVPGVMNKCYEIYGPNCIETSAQTQAQNVIGFPYCRLLKTDCHGFFCETIVEEILSGACGMPLPEITAKNKSLLVNFLANEKVSREEINGVYHVYPLETHQEILLILRGLLACGVLCSALGKRWRVNYGVNPNGYRRMAVPFRAKDVAAERTEFGHPDIAIVLTQLSYYYSGLEDEQLDQCFVNLFLQPDPILEYQRWIQYVPKDVRGYESIQHLSGVNLKDFFQRTKILFPALRKNTAVIDFWLGSVVFPQESKQFHLKIGCSPWDLCTESGHPTTGFSGTNDSKLLLPKTIHQRGIPALEGTNGQVLKNLLRPENNTYEHLPLGITATQILRKLVKCSTRLLLDCGALMLELNNAQVASTWLSLEAEDNLMGESAVEAAVYFDESNKLVVIDRVIRTPVPLELSTYRSRLDSCVIYLDDAHTRGTDLKIPAGVSGCVTLGKGVTKDKLVQGCMRMRKLGQGHTVIFWASHEIHNAIKGLTQAEKIGTKEVLQWAIDTTRTAIEEGFIHWAGAGVYQAQKLSSHEIYAASKGTNDDLKMLSDGCSEKETIDLKTMYGEVRTLKAFPLIVDHLLKRVNRELGKRLNKSGQTTKLNVKNIVEGFGQVVVSHSKKYVPNITRLSQCLEEEQERELEHELEAQHEKESPPKLKAYDHMISDGVTQFCQSGALYGIERWAIKLPLVLKHTSVWKQGASDTWGQHIYASQDFIRVSKTPTSSMETKVEPILRPAHWIVSVSFDPSDRNPDRTVVLLLISPFEANYYYPEFLGGKQRAVLHMFAGRLCPGQDTLYRNPALNIPVSMNYLSYNFPSSIHSALLLFSGSSYFECKEEQDEYCRFTGFCLKERNVLEDAVFQKGGIVNGFVAPEHFEELGYSNCRFLKNPEALIKRIIELRSGSFFNDSHIGIMIIQHTKPFQA